MNTAGGTREAFTEALEHHFAMASDDARDLADVVLGTFGDVEEVDDELLDAEVRSVFYTLESKKMLSFRRTEYTRETGEKRRAFYWKLRHEALTTAQQIPVDIGEVDVYAELPASAWHHAS